MINKAMVRSTHKICSIKMKMWKKVHGLLMSWAGIIGRKKKQLMADLINMNLNKHSSRTWKSAVLAFSELMV